MGGGAGLRGPAGCGRGRGGGEPEDGVIRVDNLHKRYGAVVAVEGLSFQVEPGETFALIGPNGAGKTTTLKMLLGLARPDRGSIRLGSRPLSPDDPRARHDVGYVPQRVEFPPARSVADVLPFYAALRGLPRQSVARALERVRLTSHAPRRATELSGGYTQRLSLGQALLGDPALLVLDEPTASLDPEATWEFRSLLESLRREGRTILLCSHLLAEVERIADRVLILVNGRRAALEGMNELRARQIGATCLVIEPHDPDAARLLLEARGFAVERHRDHALRIPAQDGRGLHALDTLRAGGLSLRCFELERPT